MSKLNWKKVTVILVIMGLTVVFAGLGIKLYADNQYTNTKNQLDSIANGYASTHPYWNANSRYLFALQENPGLSNSLNNYSNLSNSGVIILAIGGAIIAISLVLFVVQRQFIKTIDTRIKQAEQKASI